MTNPNDKTEIRQILRDYRTGAILAAHALRAIDNEIAITHDRCILPHERLEWESSYDVRDQLLPCDKVNCPHCQI